VTLQVKPGFHWFRGEWNIDMNRILRGNINTSLKNNECCGGFALARVL